MNFVLDASVTLAWAFEDEGGEYAVRVLEELRSSEAVAASLWPLEVANGLLTAERRGRLEASGARQFLHLLLSLPVVVDPVGRRRAFEGIHRPARTHDLTSYDAAYLEVPHVGQPGQEPVVETAPELDARLSTGGIEGEDPIVRSIRAGGSMVTVSCRGPKTRFLPVNSTC